ncbi:MAG: protocatechuate 3,4-dioxygenase subunit alpha [Jatrophihabitans sp.]|uniref:protocatechuate 3,4-dioxygenase subunit alpha n=1 Tax=Jatrophihabitans sp. TaxID=1932789 RepID=UPI003F7E442D
MPDLAATPGQTIGPFFHDALPYPGDRELVPVGSPGSLLLHGVVLDGEGHGVPDALVEIRQADATGAVPTVEGSIRRAGSPFTGWGRSSTDRTGRYWFSTVEPAAPFVAVTVFARGLLDVLFTRAYLPTGDHADDALLARLPADDRAALVAVREPDGNLRFDIRLQGERQTPFLGFPGHRG